MKQNPKSRLKINFKPLYEHFLQVIEQQHQNVRKKHRLLLKSSIK